MEWLDIVEHATAAFNEDYSQKLFQVKLAGYKVRV